MGQLEGILQLVPHDVCDHSARVVFQMIKEIILADSVAGDARRSNGRLSVENLRIDTCNKR
jgi:hypothetical protein